MCHVDAFTTTAFAGNPAAVCVLPEDRPDEWMQSLAREMNLSETAFLRRLGEGTWSLRWLTPAVEVNLCGHATLAAAHVLAAEGLWEGTSPVRFQTRSGELTVGRGDGVYTMNFPADPVKAIPRPNELEVALGVPPVYTARGKEYLLVEIGSLERLRKMRPRMGVLAGLPFLGVVVTCEGPGGDEPHFYSRFFAPAAGIAEDPVTGSAHCTLATHWAKRLDRTTFLARQVSARGGELRVELHGERVNLIGSAVTVTRGELLV
ncbi:PhzF family phenazine biosynthesis isomerase [bacterium]|nr:PhzF family phenazine biosynthesis isomerase [bacterium]